MARLAWCMVLISLCLCLILEPALASTEGPKSRKVKHNVPASAPFPSAVPSEQALIQQLCKDTRKPNLCRKIVQGDKVALDPVTEAKIAIDIALSMASRATVYLSKQLKTNHASKVVTKGPLEVCKLSYENIVADLNISYINFETKTKKAIERLKHADAKVESCASALKLGGKDAEIPPVHEANKVIKSLIMAAQSGAKKKAH